VDSGTTCATTVSSNEASWLESNPINTCGIVAEFCETDTITFHVGADGKVYDVTGAVTPTEETCLLAALADVCFPNVADSTVDVMLFGPCD
jgi:hypothetical protein